MPQLRKLRKSKKFRYNVSRKRLNKKQNNTGTIKCPQIKEAWERTKTMTTNLNEIGLAYDPNKTVKVPNAKEQRLKLVKKIHGFLEEDNDTSHRIETARPKGFVMEQLEADATALRESNFRLPKGVVSFLSDMLDAHGLNYAAMVRDKKNYDQWTWKQFRGKIRKFMGIPEQFGPYLKSRNLNKDNLNWIEYETDDEL